MDENDKKLLQLYKKDIRKKRIIVFLLILIFIGGFSLYYFYIDLKQLTKESNSNNNEITSNSIELKDTNEEININVTNESKTQKTDENKTTGTTVNKVETEEIKEQINKDTNVDKKEDTTKKDNKQEETTEKVTTNATEKPKNKDFLFSDGYTMDNVTQAAQSYLKSSNWSGECIPIKDSDGVYLGMRVIFY